MGLEKYETFVRRAKNTLTYSPDWSRENPTGAWRALRPVRNADLCNDCGLCWLYCPDSCITDDTYEIDYTYCKGCGICAEECKVAAIKMEREEES
jgi:pyruvate ferredoxin oxidoreductase delta subunit